MYRQEPFQKDRIDGKLQDEKAELSFHGNPEGINSTTAASTNIKMVTAPK